MNLAQSLGAAAAALVVAMSANGAAPAQTVSRVVANARVHLEPAAVRDAVEELAAMLEQRYVFSEVGQHYGGAPDPQQLAAQLTGELNSIHRDAHLRAMLSDGSELGRRALRAPQGDEAFGEYLRDNTVDG